MFIDPKGYTVLIERATHGDEHADCDFEWEFDTEEPTDEPEGETGDNGEPHTEGDEAIESFMLKIVEDEMCMASDASALLIEAAAQFNLKAGLTPSDAPYAPHPAAAALDEVITYDASDAAAQHQHKLDSERVATTSRAITGQMRRVLTARAQSRVQRDQQRGKLDRRKLAGINQPGRIQPNRNVFQKLALGQTSKVAIGILVDQSASMNSMRKMTCAREAATALGNALSLLTPLGLKFAIWGFDTDVERCARVRNKAETCYDRIEPLRAHVYKTLDEDWRRVAARCGAMHAHLDNCDGESIRWAAQQLLTADNVDRRVLIVLSDGIPACHSARDAIGGQMDGQERLEADTKLAVEQTAALGIEILGIGVCSSSVEKFYPSHIVINNPSELESVLMTGLKTTLGVGNFRKAS